MLFDDLPGAGEADAGAGHPAGGVGGAVEALEDVGKVVGRDPDPFIPDREKCPAGAFAGPLAGYGDGDVAAIRAVLDGVADQIEQDPPEADAIGLDAEGGGIRGDRDFAAVRLPTALGLVLDPGDEVERLEIELQFLTDPEE